MPTPSYAYVLSMHCSWTVLPSSKINACTSSRGLLRIAGFKSIVGFSLFSKCAKWGSKAQAIPVILTKRVRIGIMSDFAESSPQVKSPVREWSPWVQSMFYKRPYTWMDTFDTCKWWWKVSNLTARAAEVCIVSKVVSIWLMLITLFSSFSMAQIVDCDIS